MNRAARVVLGIGLLGCGRSFAGGPEPPPAPLPEPPSVQIDKNRFISFAFPDAPEGTQWAVRVKIVELYNTDPNHPDLETCPTYRALDFSGHEGEIAWVGSPEVLPNTPLNTGHSFVGAALDCCPVFLDWNGTLGPVWTQACGGAYFCSGVLAGRCLFGSNPCNDTSDCNPQPVVNAYGASILPCSKYEVQLVADTCPDLGDESCYSAPLTVRTALWGDVAPLSGGASQPNFIDIGYVVQVYKGLPCFAKVQAMLRGTAPPVDENIGFLDVGLCVDAYKRKGYYQSAPTECTEPCP
jgi:hypothetical protein